MLQTLFLNIIIISLSVSAVIALLLILLPVLNKKYPAKWRYWVWLILAIRLLMPFNPSLPQALVTIPQPVQNTELAASVQNTVQSLDNPKVPQVNKLTPQTPKKAAANTISLFEILSAVWALGAILFLLYQIWGYFLFRRSVSRFSRPVQDSQTIKIWREVKAKMQIRRDIPVMLCNSIQSPMMTGFINPVLLLPYMDFDSTELEIILYHELIHYKRKDIWYKLLLICVNAVHWFNPLVYLMIAQSNKDIEMVCDSEVVKDADMVFRKQYGQTILSAVHKRNLRQLKFSTYFCGGKKIMKERFINIFDVKKKNRGIVALCAILITVCMIGGLVACQDAKAAMQIKSDSPVLETNQPSDISPSPVPSKSAKNSAGSSIEASNQDEKNKDAQNSASASNNSKGDATKDAEKSAVKTEDKPSRSASPTNSNVIDTGEIANKTKDYLLNGQEGKSEAEKLHWSEAFLNQVDIEAVYKEYISNGGKAGNIKKFAEFLTENAPVPKNWKELFEAEYYASYDAKITRYKNLQDNYYQVYVKLDGAEVPYVTVNARTGWFHG